MKTLEELVIQSQNEIPRKSLDEVESSNAFIIDVRQLEEVNATQLINGAVHIPRGKLEFAISQLEGISVDSNIYLYCAAGIRSAMAGSTLKTLGYANIFNLGGFIDLLENQ
jgi:rhodanese-related sulfurtransferase